MVKAERNGEEAEFSQAVWDLMPPDKYGWREKIPTTDFTPPELQPTLTGTPPVEPGTVTAQNAKDGTSKK